MRAGEDYRQFNIVGNGYSTSMRSISLHRFASTTLLKDITACSDAFAASSTNGTKEKCIQFLRCLKVSDFAVRLMSPVGNRHKEHVLVPYHSIFEQFDVIANNL